ncbi:Hypothetical predicted protein [Podarcis lilfordi]|uniref:Uncharacterized protein n=1 Tax=Podarcis lilfordi TaxID=74358 RepID=A0AA35JYU0_9SAUR|nr:Hypothetical predicted protein [Podarcis lilfordi]
MESIVPPATAFTAADSTAMHRYQPLFFMEEIANIATGYCRVSNIDGKHLLYIQHQNLKGLAVPPPPPLLLLLLVSKKSPFYKAVEVAATAHADCACIGGYNDE